MREYSRAAIVLMFSATLFALHNDEWLWMPNGRHAFLDFNQPILGWLPLDIAYNMAWVILGIMLCNLVIRWTWRNDA